MKFLDFYNSIIGEAKIDDLLFKSKLDEKDAIFIRYLNELLDNKSKYVQWLINNINDIQQEEIVYDVNYFEKNQSRFKEKDIMKYSVEELDKTVKEIKSKPTKAKFSIEASKDAPKVFENDKCAILRIDSYEASKKYGQGTKWCISMKNEDAHWIRYTKEHQVKFYFLIPKNPNYHDEKYAFSSYGDGTIECFDSEDLIVDAKLKIKDFEINKSIFKPYELTLEDKIQKCMQHGVKWHVDTNGSINANGIVVVRSVLVENGKLIVKFGTIDKDFICNDLNLTTFEGFPQKIGWNLGCSRNNFEFLNYFPKEVGGRVYIVGNVGKRISPEEIRKVSKVGKEIIT